MIHTLQDVFGFYGGGAIDLDSGNRAFDAGGNVLGSPSSFTLWAWGWGQYGYSGLLVDGGIRIEATQNAVCYGVEVNNVSNDGTFQLATPF